MNRFSDPGRIVRKVFFTDLDNVVSRTAITGGVYIGTNDRLKYFSSKLKNTLDKELCRR
jgi:hypothetical protein